MDENGTRSKRGIKQFESYSCAIVNVAGALEGAGGPKEGENLFSYNYYGPNLFVDETDLFNEINKEDRISKSRP